MAVNEGSGAVPPRPRSRLGAEGGGSPPRCRLGRVRPPGGSEAGVCAAGNGERWRGGGVELEIGRDVAR